MRFVINPSYSHSSEIINDFNLYKDSIYFKDYTQYTKALIKTLLEAIVESKKYGLSNKHILWLTKRIYEKELTKRQVEEDYLPLIKFHFYNQDLLNTIQSYNDISSLSSDIEKLNLDNEIISDNELDIFFEKDGWFIAMPHTTKSSCFLGKGTTWCTARTKSQNLFLNYVGKFEDNIILFYVIKINGNPKKNPNDKLSIGFQDGEPIFDGEDGNITVNAENKGLFINDFSEIVGNKLAKEMLIKMDEKSQSLGGKHPAKKEMERISKSVNKYLNKISEFKNEQEKTSFKNELFRYNLSEEMQDFIVKNENESFLKILAKNPSILEPIQLIIANDNREWVRANLACNTNLTKKTQLKLAKDKDFYVLIDLAKNKNLFESVQLELADNKAESIRRILAENNLFKSTQKKLSNDESTDVLTTLSFNPVIESSIQLKLYKIGYKESLARNPNLIDWIQIKLSNEEDDTVKEYLASNKNLNEKAQFILSNSRKKIIRDSLAENSNITDLVQLKLANDEDADVRSNLARNINLIESLQLKLADDTYQWTRKNLARNPNIYESTQLKLTDDKDEWIRENLAENIKIFESTQLKLTDDKEVSVRMALAKNKELFELPQLKLADDKNQMIRVRLARNIKIFESVQLKLADDKSEYVIESLEQNPNLFDSVKRKLDIKKAYT